MFSDDEGDWGMRFLSGGDTETCVINAQGKNIYCQDDVVDFGGRGR